MATASIELNYKLATKAGRQVVSSLDFTQGVSRATFSVESDSISHIVPAKFTKRRHSVSEIAKSCAVSGIIFCDVSSYSTLDTNVTNPTGQPILGYSGAAAQPRCTPQQSRTRLCAPSLAYRSANTHISFDSHLLHSHPLCARGQFAKISPFLFRATTYGHWLNEGTGDIATGEQKLWLWTPGIDV